MKLAFFFALSALSLMFISAEAFDNSAHADDSVVTGAKNTVGDIKTTAKKEGRAMKRKARKIMGNDTVAKDAKDKANDVKDSVSNSLDKARGD
jgi:hypothetical protein